MRDSTEATCGSYVHLPLPLRITVGQSWGYRLALPLRLPLPIIVGQSWGCRLALLSLLLLHLLVLLHLLLGVFVDDFVRLYILERSETIASEYCLGPFEGKLIAPTGH